MHGQARVGDFLLPQHVNELWKWPTPILVAMPLFNHTYINFDSLPTPMVHGILHGTESHPCIKLD